MSKRLDNSKDSADIFRQADLADEQGDTKKAFSLSLTGARLGNLLCQLNVGILYATGIGVKKDLREAARWYKRAYRGGASAAAINLSLDLRNQGNLRGAIAWLKRAVAMGDGEACLQLAQMYLQSHRQKKAAIALLKKAVASWPANISEDGRDEAAALLRRFTNVA